MRTSESYTVTVLLDVNNAQDIDDRAEARTYLVADRGSGKAVIIDAVIENLERDCKTIRDLGLTLLFALETHVHADHITGASQIKERTGARIVYGGSAKGVVIGADIFLFDGETLLVGDTLRFGTPEVVCSSRRHHRLSGSRLQRPGVIDDRRGKAMERTTEPVHF
jgi:sulfur dioxygenase